jgi:ribosomal protein S18 acetylase RimI-like enzyme
MVTTVREAGSADIDAITRVTNAAFAVERFFAPVDRTSAERVASLMRKGAFLLAEDSDQLLGSVYVELRGDRVYIGLLAVSPAQQRRGLGRTLMDAAEDYGRSRGCANAEITVVNLREELPAFYRSRGYVEAGTLPFDRNEPATRPCYFIVMIKRLDGR